MASPAYATDLTTSLQGNEATETWDESSDAGYDDAGSMVDDSNLYYINTECVSAQFTKSGIGSIIGSLGTTITVPTDGAILMHHLWAAPPALATFANGGMRMLIGDSLGDFDVYYTSGSDKAPAPEGGWATFAVDPSQTPQGTTVGTPTVISYVGAAVSATAQARGNPHAVQAIRYGRCEQEYTIGDSGDPAKFSGYAAIDSTSTTRYNLLQPIKGGYQLRGLASFGTTATAVFFDDANINISLADDINVSANFNRFEVNNSGSLVKMTAISISALGTTSKGRFVVVDDAVVEKTSCTFTDMDYFTYQSNSILLSTTYRRCGLITQGSAAFTSCTFDKPSGAVGMSANNLSDVTKCTFNSDGTGHAVDMGTISSDLSANWDNFESGYTDSSSGDETILVSVDSGITLTINVQTGASTPYYYNTGTGTVSIVSGSVSINIHVEDQSATDLQGALVYIDEDLEAAGNIINTSTNATGDVATSYSGAATSATVRIRKYGYKPYVGTISLLSDSQTNVTLITDPQQT